MFNFILKELVGEKKFPDFIIIRWNEMWNYKFILLS